MTAKFFSPSDPVRVIAFNERVASPGLLGVEDSVAYEIDEIEHHIHNWERWLGLATAPSGETHRADRIGTTTAPFVADAGNVTWGAWLQILGSADTPIQAGKARFDIHRIMITAVERTNPYYVQVGFGTSGAAALTSGEYTEFVYAPQSVLAEVAPIDMMNERMPVGTKVWVRCFCPTQNTGTMSFYIGVHEYIG